MKKRNKIFKRKQEKNLPVIILDLILPDSKMSDEEISILEILKRQNIKRKNEFVHVNKWAFDTFYIWIVELKKEKGESRYVLYSENLSKCSAEYDSIGRDGDNSVVAKGIGFAKPIHFNFFKENNKLNWTIRIEEPRKKEVVKEKVEDVPSKNIEEPKKKKRSFYKLLGIFLMAIGIKLTLAFGVLAIKPNLPENLQEYLVIDSNTLNLIIIAALAFIFFKMGSVAYNISIFQDKFLASFEIGVREDMIALRKIKEALLKVNITPIVSEEKMTGKKVIKKLYVNEDHFREARGIVMKIYRKALIISGDEYFKQKENNNL